METGMVDDQGANRHNSAGEWVQMGGRAGLPTANVASGGGSNVGGLGGGRQACNVCRARKVRCDRAEPKCGRCIRLRQNCIYDGAARAALPAQVLQLQARLARAEARLAISQAQAYPLHAPTSSSPVAPDPSGPSAFAPEPAWQQVTQQPTPTASLAHEHFLDTASGLHGPVVAQGQGGLGMPEFNFDDIDIFNSATTSSGSMDLVFDWPTDLPAMTAPTSSRDGSAPLLSPSGTSLSSSAHPTGGVVPPEDMAALHDLYFEVIYPTFPIICKERFVAELARDPMARPLSGLSYAIALIGSAMSAEHAHLQELCYSLARTWLELCERDDEGMDLANLNVFQALLLIIRYEIIGKRLTRAWMTLGRAIRLANVLNLHQMDRHRSAAAGVPDLQMALPSTQDLALLEERRRSFWALFILESYASTRTGLPCQLGSPQTFEVNLPSPGHMTGGFIPAPMPFLRDASRLIPEAPLSTYAGCVLMVGLALRCFDHSRTVGVDEERQGFWDRHYALVKTINDCTAVLHPHLSARAVRDDPIAFTLHLNLCATEIFFHEAAIRQVLKQELSPAMAAESKRRATTLTFKIANTARLVWPAQRSERDFFTLQATFVAWPLVMAMSALHRDLVASEDATASGVADNVRLLLGALDQVEDQGGHWHTHTAAIAAALKEWDESHV